MSTNYRLVHDGKTIGGPRAMKAADVAPWKKRIARIKGIAPNEIEVATEGTMELPGGCPKCGAVGSDPCVTPSGAEARAPHSARS